MALYNVQLYMWLHVFVMWCNLYGFVENFETCPQIIIDSIDAPSEPILFVIAAYAVG